MIKRIFNDLQRKENGRKGCANLTKTMGQAKTLPLITLIKRIYADRK